ncbi:MAG: tetratricopeptide repeat protein [Myxococcota bacterium]|nr:tetratricopeptide repeat protein [Myxococcota bacterium]
MERHLILNGNHPCFAEAGDNDGGGEQSLVTDLSGQDLGGRFRLDELRTDTAAGQTYSGSDTAGDAPVWIFVAAHAFTSDDPALSALEETIAKSFEIDHGNVLPLRHMDQTDDGRTYIVSEKQDGLSLAEKLAADGPIMPRIAGRITQELLQALKAVHETGLIHQGIRPDTIFLVQDDVGVERAVLGGLGQHHTLAMDTASQRENSACRAQPEYLSPEAVAGKDLTQQTDLYALGLVLYEMLTGRTAFGGGDFRKTARQHAITRPLSPRIVRRQAQIPRSLDAVVMKLLEKTPTRRFGSIDEVTEALDAVANEDDSSRNRTSLNFKPVASRKPEPIVASVTESADAAEDSAPATENVEQTSREAEQTSGADSANEKAQSEQSEIKGAAAEPSTENKSEETRARPTTEPLVSISSKIAVSKAPESSDPHTDEPGLGELDTEATKFKETGRWFVESVDELQATNPNLAAQFDEYTIPKDRNIFPIIVLVLGLIVGGLVWSTYDADVAEDAPEAVAANTADSDNEDQKRRAEIAAKATAVAKADAATEALVPDAGQPIADATAPQTDAAKSPLTAEQKKRNDAVERLQKQALAAIQKKNWQGSEDALLETILALKKIDPEDGFDGPLSETVKDAVLLSVTELTAASDFAAAKRNARLAKTLMPGLQIAHTMLKRVETLEAAAEKKKAAEDKKRLAEEKAKAEEQKRKEASEKKRIAAEKKKQQDEEKKRLAAEKKKQDAEQKRLAAEKKKQRDAEKTRLAAEKKKERDAEKRRLAAEKKKERDADQKRLAAEKKRLAAEKKKRDAEKKAAGATSDPYRDAQNHLRSGRWAQAKVAFNKSIQSNPNRSGAYAGLGRVAFQQGQNKVAAKHYAKAVRLSPGSVNYRINLGLAYFKLGRYDRAKKHWNKALSLSPGNKKATRYLKLLEKKAAK